jgi:hypothetical protein
VLLIQEVEKKNLDGLLFRVFPAAEDLSAWPPSTAIKETSQRQEKKRHCSPPPTTREDQLRVDVSVTIHHVVPAIAPAGMLCF